MWVNGPFRCGTWPDVKIFRRDLKNMLLPNEMVEADKGYPDEKCRHCDVVFSPSDARAKEAVMGRHESVNGDLKTFGCLDQVWRHPLENHSTVFGAAVVMVQMKYTLYRPKFQVRY